MDTFGCQQGPGALVLVDAADAADAENLLAGAAGDLVDGVLV